MLGIYTILYIPFVINKPIANLHVFNNNPQVLIIGVYCFVIDIAMIPEMPWCPGN